MTVLRDTRHRRFALVALLAASTSCGGANEDLSNPELASASEAATRGVWGFSTTTYVNETETSRRSDLRAVTVAALVPRSDGGFDRYRGVGTSWGLFYVRGVPRGSYYLQIGSDYIVTSARWHSLRRTVVGRPKTPSASAGTRLNLSLTDVNPFAAFLGPITMSMWSWQAGTVIPSPAASSDDFFFGTFSPDLLTEADFDFPYDVAANPAHLMQDARAYALDIAPVTSSTGQTYLRPTKFAAFGNVTVNDGTATNKLSAALQPVAKTRPFRPGLLEARAFTKAAVAIDPTTTPGFPLFQWQVSASPRSSAYVVTATMPLAAYGWATEGSDEPLDRDFGEIALAELPIKGRIQRTFAVQIQRTKQYQMPDGGRRSATGRIGNTMAYERARAPYAPMVGAPLELKVDGKSGYDDLTAIGKPLVVTWSKPTVGAVTGYQLRIMRFPPSVPTSPTGTATPSPVPVATLHTRDTTIVLPPELLPAEPVYLELTALSGAGYRPANPLERRLPLGEGQTLSGLVHPASPGN